jgi:hypothetical protein
MDLIRSGFQRSNVFSHMPLFDEILYIGQEKGKVRHFKATREGQTCDFFALNFIRKDEFILWEAVEDFLKRSTLDATAHIRGVYIFDLLTIDIHKEHKAFKHSELSAVIANEAHRLIDGQIDMVKYSSIYALLHKTVSADWGKIIFKSAVDVFKDSPEYLDLFIKRFLKDFQFPHDPVILVLNDLSQNPVFDIKNKEQQERIKKVVAQLIPNSIEFVPEVYIQDRTGARELLSGSVLK